MTSPRAPLFRFLSFLAATLVPAFAGAQTVVATIPVGAGPQAVVVNPVTDRAYVAVNGASRVAVIDRTDGTFLNLAVPAAPVALALDPASQRVFVGMAGWLSIIDATSTVTSVAVPHAVTALAVNPVTGEVYALDHDSNFVYVFNGATGVLTGLYSIQCPGALAVNAVTNRVYVTSDCEGWINVIDGAAQASHLVVSSFGPRAIAVNPVTNRVYVAFSGATLRTLDAASETWTTVAGVFTTPVALAVNPTTNRIYVADFGAGGLAVIDGSGNNVTTGVAMGGSPSALTVDTIRNRVYATIGGGTSVTAFDGNTLVVSSIPVGTDPASLAINPVTARLFVANNASGDVTVIDGKVFKHTALAVADTRAAAVNPFTNRAYLASGGAPGHVTVVDTTTNAIVTTVAVGNDPTALAIDFASNRVYTSDSTSSTVTVIDGATNATATLTLPAAPGAIAVNTATRALYVAQPAAGNVAVFDGLELGVPPTPVSVGGTPSAIAVDARSGWTYVTTGTNVAVIDGSNATNTLMAAPTTGLGDIAVDPATGHIYIAKTDLGGQVLAYAYNGSVGTSIATYPVPSPRSLAVDSLTQKVYAATGTSDLDIIDPTVTPSSSAVATVTLPDGANAVTLDEVARRAFVSGNTQVATIDMLTQWLSSSLTPITTSAPGRAAVDPVTGKAFVPVAGAPNAVIVADTPTPVLARHGLDVSYGFGGLMSNNSTPMLSASVCCGYAPFNPAAVGARYSLNGVAGPWVALGGSGPCAASLAFAPGLHYVMLFANDAISGTSVVGQGGGFSGTSDLIGTPVVVPVAQVDGQRVLGSSFPAGKQGVPYSGGTVSTIGGLGQLTYTALSVAPDGLTMLRDTGAFAGTPTRSGHFIFSVAVTDASGGFADVPATIDIAPGDPSLAAPVSTDLGSQVVGFAAPTRSITVSNPGWVNLVVGAEGISGIAASDFGIVSNNCATVVPTGTCTIQVSFTPSAPGPRTATLNIASNDPATPTRFITLTGTGIAVDTAPDAFAFAPATGVLPGSVQTSNAITVSGINVASPISITGGTFSIGCSTFPAVSQTIANGQTVCVRLTASATLGAAASATLTIGGVSATFTSTTTTVPQMSLAVAKSGAGTGRVTTAAGTGIDCGSTCGAIVPVGTSVVLTAAPDPGWAFAGWSGACTGTAPCQLTMDAAKSVTASFTAPVDAPRLGAISTRVQALGGDGAMIGGFIIGGSTPKTVVVRARGPSLASQGVANPLVDPVLQLVASDGTVTTNDNWGSAPNAAQIQASGFAPADGRESVVMGTFPPGAYTAIVSGAGGSTGVAIVEVFEVDHPETPLAGISTRGDVLSGNNVMIGGFIISGTAPQTVVVRARGPSLASQGVAGSLSNPVLQLVASDGTVTTNDDWGSAPNAAQIQASGFAPGDARESAILVTLQPGAYTAIVSGAGGATGIGIVEVFAVQ